MWKAKIWLTFDQSACWWLKKQANGRPVLKTRYASRAVMFISGFYSRGINLHRSADAMVAMSSDQKTVSFEIWTLKPTRQIETTFETTRNIKSDLIKTGVSKSKSKAIATAGPDSCEHCQNNTFVICRLLSRYLMIRRHLLYTYSDIHCTNQIGNIICGPFLLMRL